MRSSHEVLLIYPKETWEKTFHIITQTVRSSLYTIQIDTVQSTYCFLYEFMDV